MLNTLATLCTLAFALHPVLAKVYVTSPVTTTAATGGQVLNVQWADDGETPTVGSIGPCSIDLYTGSLNVQTQLQNLATSVDVSKASSVSATIDPTVGQSGEYYFVRFASLALKDTNNPQYPYEAFSAIFTINSMSGTFNSSILAEISGSSSSSMASSTIMSTSTVTSTHASSATVTVLAAAATATGSAASKASSVTSAVAKESSTSAQSGAIPRLATPFGLMLGVAGLAGYFCS
ncbi:MAG: hypothetical protein TREMPRED_001986 [Tremellales sp. Tagirdzhanova-0007]|nr:MAG: hypothetical protein TREMPRED_001986 [Tremellales sp. Tagirdzhanova-0007]